MRYFSYKDRPVHLGPFPLERLRRSEDTPPLHRLAEMERGGGGGGADLSLRRSIFAHPCHGPLHGHVRHRGATVPSCMARRRCRPIRARVLRT